MNDINVLNFVLIVAVMVISFCLGRLSMYADTVNDRRNLEYYRKRYQTRFGFTKFRGKDVNYRLVSIDEGKTWYIVDKDYSIWGNVEWLHPGLLDHIRAVDALADYVTANGPITLKDEAEAKLLDNANIHIHFD